MGAGPGLAGGAAAAARTAAGAYQAEAAGAVAAAEPVVGGAVPGTDRQAAPAGVEIAAIWARLQEQGYTGGYHPVYRLVRKLAPTQPEVFVRVERKPGEEAQVDFGYVGYLLDAASGRRRKAWAFVMTLSWSRHMYVEFVFDQTVATWLRLHRNALAFFSGVPQRIVIDNLKAGIVTACFDDPQVQHAYGECAEHYGFRVAPCRPATQNTKAKWKVACTTCSATSWRGATCDLAQASAMCATGA
ncbi:MAG: IS21 family transposase [Caldilineaceae bacterium]